MAHGKAMFVGVHKIGRARTTTQRRLDACIASHEWRLLYGPASSWTTNGIVRRKSLGDLFKRCGCLARRSCPSAEEKSARQNLNTSVVSAPITCLSFAGLTRCRSLMYVLGSITYCSLHMCCISLPSPQNSQAQMSNPCFFLSQRKP